MEYADTLGMENVCFSLAKECSTDDEERQTLWKKQRMERGFDDTELWNLDNTILKFVLPRLKAFKDVAVGTPYNFDEEKWEECIDKMIKSIESIIEDGDNVDYEGFELFKKYFFNLWW